VQNSSIQSKPIPKAEFLDRALKNIVQKTISLILKAGIIIAAFGFIYNQLFVKQDLYSIKVFASSVLTSLFDYLLLGVVVLLMGINWGLETKKWHFLICKFEKISFQKALKAVFAGTCISIFTPNRVGEFGGRIFYLKKADRIQAILATIIGNIGQLIITIILGSCSFVFYLMIYSEIELGKYQTFGILIAIFALVVTLIYLFLNANKITQLLNRFSIISRLKLKAKNIKKWEKYTSVFSLYTRAELITVLVLCFARYLVFCLQFFILLYVFEVKTPFAETMAMISLSFFVLAIVPTVALTEIGVRGSISLFFIGLLSDNGLGIITASLSLWIINLVVPAIIGSYFITGLTFFRKKHNLLSFKNRLMQNS
jgi:hypothetical protein